MPQIIDLKTFTDKRGNLTVIEKVLPFDIKRVFYIYGVDDSVRGGHRHKKTIQATICIQGKCTVFCDNSKEQSNYVLHQPNQCLILQTEDWHEMYNFSENCILMVFASECFDESDYIFEPY